jgi:hypothetical protein
MTGWTANEDRYLAQYEDFGPAPEDVEDGPAPQDEEADAFARIEARLASPIDEVVERWRRDIQRRAA